MSIHDKIINGALLLWLISYLLVSFAYYDLNPKQWNSIGRAIFGLITIGLFFRALYEIKNI